MSYTGDFEASLPDLLATVPSDAHEGLHVSAEQLIASITRAIPPKRTDGEGGYWDFSLPNENTRRSFFKPISLATTRSHTTLNWDNLYRDSLITCAGVVSAWLGIFQYSERDTGNRVDFRYNTSFSNLHDRDDPSLPGLDEVIIRKYVQMSIFVPDGIDTVEAFFTTNDLEPSVWRYGKMQEAIRREGERSGKYRDAWLHDYAPTPTNLETIRATARNFFMELKLLEATAS